MHSQAFVDADCKCVTRCLSPEGDVAAQFLVREDVGSSRTIQQRRQYVERIIVLIDFSIQGIHKSLYRCAMDRVAIGAIR